MSDWYLASLLVGAGVGFAHRRLAVIDPTPHGRQPMSRGDGRWTLTGVKPWCSGADLCTHALITAVTEDADGDDGLHLRLVDMAEIEENGFDLNIGRYIQTEAAAEVDVEAALAAYQDARAALREAERILDKKLKAAGFDA